MKNYSLIITILMFAMLFSGCSPSSTENGPKIGDSIDSYFNNDVYIGEHITLSIDYKKPSGLNYKDDVELFVDGEKKGSKQKPGNKKQYDLYLEKGKHEFYVKSTERLKNRKSNKIKINVEGEMTLYYTLEEASFRGLTLKEVTFDEP